MDKHVDSKVKTNLRTSSECAQAETNIILESDSQTEMVGQSETPIFGVL